MYDSAEQADSDPKPLNDGIGAIDVIHLAPKPNSQETAKLVGEKDDAIERAHVAQSIDMRDQTRGKRHCGQPKCTHDHGK